MARNGAKAPAEDTHAGTTYQRGAQRDGPGGVRPRTEDTREHQGAKRDGRGRDHRSPAEDTRDDSSTSSKPVYINDTGSSSDSYGDGRSGEGAMHQKGYVV